MSPGEEGGGEGEIQDRSHTQQINGISIVRMHCLGVGRELRQEGGWEGEPGYRSVNIKKRDNKTERKARTNKKIKCTMRILKTTARDRNTRCIQRQLPAIIPAENACA